MAAIKGWKRKVTILEPIVNFKNINLKHEQISYINLTAYILSNRDH